MSGLERFQCYTKLGVNLLLLCNLLLTSSARFLVVNVEPLGVGVIFPVLGVLGLYFSMSFLFKTGCIDSGILPRALPDEIAYMQSQGDEGNLIHLTGFSPYLGSPPKLRITWHISILVLSALSSYKRLPNYIPIPLSHFTVSILIFAVTIPISPCVPLPLPLTSLKWDLKIFLKQRGWKKSQSNHLK